MCGGGDLAGLDIFSSRVKGPVNKMLKKGNALLEAIRCYLRMYQSSPASQ